MPHPPRSGVPLACAALSALLAATTAPAAPLTFSVTLDPAVAPAPVSGRLIVLLVRTDPPPARLPARTSPVNGPFEDDPQPLFGRDARGLAPGAVLVLDDGDAAFPVAPSLLPPGTYKAQARLETRRDESSWRRQPGNLYSDAAAFTIPPVDAAAPRPAPIDVPLRLTHATSGVKNPQTKGVEFISFRSPLLSRHYGRDFALNAGVVPPEGYDPSAGRAYPAIYTVPGFGGRHTFAAREAGRLGFAPDGSPDASLRAAAFTIVLDPESPNGHTLFANSTVNGPWARALTTELIPFLEAKYRLIPQPSARLLRGHSSGGWSVLWLAVTEPATFGACWSSSPDPVDFRSLQGIDIYADADAYTDPKTGAERPSVHHGNLVTLTIRQENLEEEVIGPGNTSAQQWDSWFAVWDPRPDPRADGDDGSAVRARGPIALFDPATGAIDHAVAERLRPFDIADRLRRDPGRLAPLFRERIRILVGDADTYYLNEAVALLKADLDALPDATPPADRHGWITIVPRADHSSIFATPEMAAFSADMLDHLRRAGHVPENK